MTPEENPTRAPAILALFPIIMSAAASQPVPEGQHEAQSASVQHQRPLFAGEEEEFGDEELGDDVDLGVGQYGSQFSNANGDEYTISESLQQST